MHVSKTPFNPARRSCGSQIHSCMHISAHPSKMSVRRAASALLPKLLRGSAVEASRCLGQAASLPAACRIPGLPASALARGFRSGTALRASLADVLAKEIEYEQDYSQPEELAGGPPSPFTLTEAQGDTLLTLSRSFAGGETVNVDVMVNDQPEEEPFESEEGVLDVDVGIVFNVQVVKGEMSLVFECKSDGSYLTIQHASLEPADGDYDDSVYTGPAYEELDEALRGEFDQYLAARGVTPDLGAYLLRLVHDKEQREYTHWLERVHAFVG